MTVRIFKDLQDFKANKKARENGVTQSFLDERDMTLEQYGQTLVNCKDCFNCVNCHNCVNCQYCTDCEFCVNCRRCINCQYCWGCVGCLDLDDHKGYVE